MLVQLEIRLVISLCAGNRQVLCFSAPSANQSRHYKSHTYCFSNPKTKRRSLFIKTGTFLLSRLSGRHKHAVTAVFVRL